MSFASRSRIHVALLLAGSFLAASRLAAQPAFRSFDGDHGPGQAVCETGVTHCGLPEMGVAANGKIVLQVTWQHVSVYDYDGRLIKQTPMTKFIRDAGLNPVPAQRRPAPPPSAPGPFETHVVYDEFINRWIVTVTGQNDSMIVSKSADPAGVWGGVYVSCLQDGPCLDYDPAVHIGYDRNGVYYCGGHMGEDNPNTVPTVAYDCFAIPSSEVGGIARHTPPAHINRAHKMPLDIVPAIDHNPLKEAGAPAFFASKSCGRAAPGACQNDNGYTFHWVVEVFTWKGATGAYREQVVKTDIGSRQDKWQYNKPCCGANASIPQAGSDDVTLRVAESHRLVNLVQFGSHLEGVLGSGPCTDSCGSQGVDTNNVMFWFDMDCSNAAACSVAQTAKLSGADINPEFGSVGIDQEGNVGIVASSSTASTDLSVLLWTRRKDDPPNTFQGPITVAAGKHPYTCVNPRKFEVIGNAAGVLTELDPRDGTKLWTSQQWSNDAEPCIWNTRIVEYRIALGRSKPAR